MQHGQEPRTTGVDAVTSSGLAGPFKKGLQEDYRGQAQATYALVAARRPQSLEHGWRVGPASNVADFCLEPDLYSVLKIRMRRSCQT